MSKKANPTSIGLFIVVGLALGVLGLLLFSSSRLFSRRVQCVLYFHGSLNGLARGAPVKYRGVTIGSVTKVMIHFNQNLGDYTMPVVVDIRENLLQQRLEDTLLFKDRSNFETAVTRGLRGTLEAESLVTGVLYIDLDFVPDATPPVFHQIKPLYVEIPATRGAAKASIGDRERRAIRDLGAIAVRIHQERAVRLGRGHAIDDVERRARRFHA